MLWYCMVWNGWVCQCVCYEMVCFGMVCYEMVGFGMDEYGKACPAADVPETKQEIGLNQDLTNHGMLLRVKKCPKV